MTQKNWGFPLSRRENIKSLRERDDRGPRLPDFLENPAEELEGPDPLLTKGNFRLKEATQGMDSPILKQLLEGKFVFIMNKISFISLIFGLILLGILLFIAGLLTAYYILPGGPAAVGKAMQGGGIGQMPSLPTKEDIAKSIEGAVGKLGPAPAKEEVEKDIQKAVKAVTPSFAQPAVDKIIGTEAQNPEFIEGSKRIPEDSDAGRFTVQAKVYGDGAWAMQLARKLKEEGYGAYIVRVKERNSNQLHYHSRVGVFADYMAANSLVRKLREMGNRSATVALISQGEDRISP